MKSIAFICPSLSLGGAERHLVRYVNGLHKRGYNVSIFVISSGAALVGELPPGVDVIFLKKRFIDPRAAIRLRRLLALQKPDVVFGWSSLAGFLACTAASKSSKIIVCELNYPPLSYRAYGYPTYLAWRGLTLLYKRADIVAANSDAALDVLKEWVGKKTRFARIFNPIEFDSIEAMSVQKCNISVHSSDTLRVVGMGRMDNGHKGFDILIAALSRISQKPDWTCLLVGAGPDEGELRAQVADAGIEHRVIFCGAQVNPFPFLRAADIFVLPSRREGFPNALLEAMALGKAVIAADCLTGPREITQDGECGILFPVDDSDSLAKEISRLIEEPILRKKLGDAAALRVRSAWNEEAVFARLTELIEG